MIRHRLLLATACSLILSACGGGGSGASSAGNATGSGADKTATTPTTPTPTPSRYTAISTANAPVAASNGFFTLDMLSASAWTAEGFALQGATMGNTTHVGVTDPARVTVELVRQALQARAAAPQQLATYSATTNCGGGAGTVTTTVTQQAAAKLSDNDSVRLTFNQCAGTDGNLANGTLSATITGVSGDVYGTHSGTVTLHVVFDNFAMGTGVGQPKQTLAGDMTIAVTANPASQSVTVSGSSLQQLQEWSTGQRVLRIVSDYSATLTRTSSGVTAAADFTVAGFGGLLGSYTLTMKTLQPFVYPAPGVVKSGSMLVTGNGSSTTLTFLDATSVKVDYSAKGDGAVTDTRTVTWNEFRSNY